MFFMKWTWAFLAMFFWGTAVSAGVTLNINSEDGINGFADRGHWVLKPLGDEPYPFKICHSASTQPNIKSCFRANAPEFFINVYAPEVDVVVEAYCMCSLLNVNGFFVWRKIGASSISIPALPVVVVPLDAVQLAHSRTNKCAYRHQGGVHNWGCWDDPNMAFLVEPNSDGTVTLRHFLSQMCMYASPNDGQRLALTNCDWHGVSQEAKSFTFVAVGNGKVRIQSGYDTCAYGTDTDGGTMHGWGCWDDPNMEFEIRPFW